MNNALDFKIYLNDANKKNQAISHWATGES